ncbi:TetR/AcrR family transcriptional regulator [Pseudomonadales bacterium]|nr:TetR/AcrR family transcriptional regulator [Pseudomonadales bacterium]
MDQVISAREQQRLRTREAILSAATELLAIKPIEAISINELVALAGVAKGSFYNHFPEKDSLANLASTHIRKQYQRKIMALNAGITDPASQIVRGICSFIQTSIENPRLAAVLLRGDDWITAGNHPLNEYIQHSIEAGINQKIFLERTRHHGIILILGTSRISIMRLLTDKPSINDIRLLAIETNVLILCGFGMAYESALELSQQASEAIITGEKSP